MKKSTIVLSISLLIAVLTFSCSTDSTPVYQLTTSAEPPEAGTITQSASEADEGESITITANANEHWVFDQWSGDYSGNENPASILMDIDKSVTALFVKQDYPLTIEIEGEGSVSQQVIQPKTTEYPHGTLVELTAEPDDGWRFVEWSGHVDGDENPINITVEAETNLTATFERIEYPLTITVEGEGTVEQEVIQSKTTGYPFETVVQLTPIPSDGWRFVEWDGDLSGDEEPKTITITEEKNVTVTFKPAVYLGENGITIMCPNGEVGDIGIVDGVEYEVVDRELLEQRIEEGRGSLNRKVCVSLITDMSYLFEKTNFTQKIDNWDASNVKSMRGMFSGSFFNQPIGNWDVSNVKDMVLMFYMSQFNHPIGEWNVSSVTEMGSMFYFSQFNQPIGNWDVSNVKDMRWMFSVSPFNQDIRNWDVTLVTNMRSMFSSTNFNHPIGEWNVSSVTDMNRMFSENDQFNHPIGDWNTENVDDMGGMFSWTQFNQNISSWCVWRIGTEPRDFSTDSPLTEENKPVWGTCPD